MGKQLENALNDEDALKSSTTMDILTALKEVKMTHAILKNTMIGKVVNRIKKAAWGSETGNLATNLIARWKEVSKQDSKAAKHAAGAGAANTSSSSATAVAASVNTSMKGYQPGRVKIVNLFKAQLVQNMDDYAALKNAIKIEEGMNKAMPYDRKTADYNDKARSLIILLRRREELRKSIGAGEIDPSKMATMTAADLASESARERLRETVKSGQEASESDYAADNQEKLLANAGMKLEGESLYKCNKPGCGSNRTTFHQKQTRSSDEPMTVFVKCLVCKGEYKC